MIYVGEISTAAPSAFQTPLQEKVFAALGQLDIPFERVDTDEVITMEDCVQINKKLNMKMVKTLFLCDRKQTRFFLFVTTGEKPFRSKEFCQALGVSRLSFAPAQRMKTMLGTEIGAATIFSALLDTARDVQFVIDKDVASEPWYGCSDGTKTGYMKIGTDLVIHNFMPYTGHRPLMITI